MLLVAATGDFRSRTIPNWLNASIALSAIPFWWMTGLALWPEVAVQVAVAAAVLLLFALAFHFGAMGGGDVKMVAALALWLPPGAVLKLLVIMSLAGGALTLAMLVRHKMTKSQGQLEIPRSEEHTSELQSLMRISYAVFCLKKKKKENKHK